jgi:hypothetical protein
MSAQPQLETDTYEDLLGYLLDLADMRVTVSAAGVVACGRVSRTATYERDGRRWCAMRLDVAPGVKIAERDSVHTGIIFEAGSLRHVGWGIADEDEPEKEWLAVVDHGGAREVQIIIERDQ